MPKSYTANELIELSREISRVPNTGATGSEDVDFLRFLNYYLQNTLGPLVLGSNENYYSRAIRIPLVNNTNYYRIHTRAMFNQLRDLRYVDSDGDYSRYLTHHPLGRADELRQLKGETASRPQVFWVEGDEIRIWPDIGTAVGHLEMVVPFRPSDLVLETEARKITAINGAVLTLSSTAPTSWVSTDLFDIHSPHSGAEIRAWDRGISLISGNAVTLNTAADGTISGERAAQVGDWLCLAGESAIPALPREFHSLLAQAGALKMIESVGDMEGVGLHRSEFDRSLQTSLSQLRPRIKGKKKVIRGTPFISIHGRSYY